MSGREITVDGSSHDAVQRALDSVKEGSAKHRTTVRLAPGRYVIERPLEIESGTTLAGVGRETVLVLAAGAGCHMMVNRSFGAEFIELRDLTIDGDMDRQERPAGSQGTVWACGGCFRQVSHLRITNVEARRVRQTAFHFNRCVDVRVDDFLAIDMGWSGISTSGTDDIVLRDVVVRNSGLDTRHSGIHLDGGVGAYVDAVVEDCTGNAIMIDSAFSPMTDVVVKGVGRRSFRGLSLSGAHEHPLRNVYVTGEYTDNQRAGIMVSNTENVFVVDATSAGNGEHGILLQGKTGAHHCVIADCRTADNPVPVAEVHGSSDNYLVSGSPNASGPTTLPSATRPMPARLAGLAMRKVVKPGARALRRQIRERRGGAAAPAPSPAAVAVAAQPGIRPEAKSDAVAAPSARAATNGAIPKTAATQAAAAAGATLTAEQITHAFNGTCRVCGATGRFVLDGPSLRERFRCPSCNAHLRYQGQADALVRKFGEPGTVSLAELSTQARFRSLKIFEPGVLGPFRKYLDGIDGYTKSDYWPDVAPGEERNGVRCEDLMMLTLGDQAYDLVITSDIFEHVRHPLVGFSEIRRVLRPGGLHVFSIPSQDPLRQVTRVRVDVSGDEDVFIDEPRYHLGPGNSQHLVYNDFGIDLLEKLDGIDFPTELIHFEADDPEAARLLTFVSTRRG